MVPERLRVVVAGQVDHTLSPRLPETSKRGKEVAVLGALHRERSPVLPHRYLTYLQEVEEVPCQDELDGSVVRPELLKECLELRGGFEPVASRISADVGIRNEDDQRVCLQMKHLEIISGPETISIILACQTISNKPTS